MVPIVDTLTVSLLQTRDPFGYTPEYLNILPIDAEADDSAAVGNIKPFIDTLPVDEDILTGPPEIDGFIIDIDTELVPTSSDFKYGAY